MVRIAIPFTSDLRLMRPWAKNNLCSSRLRSNDAPGNNVDIDVHQHLAADDFWSHLGKERRVGRMDWGGTSLNPAH
jgi:hypothetical protein